MAEQLTDCMMHDHNVVRCPVEGCTWSQANSSGESETERSVLVNRPHMEGEGSGTACAMCTPAENAVGFPRQRPRQRPTRRRVIEQVPTGQNGPSQSIELISYHDVEYMGLGTSLLTEEDAGVVYDGPNNVWLLATSSTHHITNNRALLNEFDGTIAYTMSSAGGESCGRGRGTASVSVFTVQVPKIMQFRSVCTLLHLVPTFFRNRPCSTRDIR